MRPRHRKPSRLADAFLEKFGGDSIEEIRGHYEVTADQVRRRFAGRATPA